MMKRVVIAYVDSGGGHRAAARALGEACRLQGRPWNIDFVNTDEVLEPVDPAHWFLRRRWSDLYNWALRHGLTYGSDFVVAFGHAAYRVIHPVQVMLLRRRWRALRPDLVVSVIPHLNRAIYQSLKQEMPGTPLVTILTDLADVPPNFWIVPQAQHYVCGTAHAVRQAEAVAGGVARVWRVSGMVLNPRFYEPAPEDRADVRRALGLDPLKPTGVVMYGGHGSSAMLRIARTVADSGLPVQLIFMCGKNVRLARSLRALQLPYPFHVQEFTDDVSRYMRISDFFIGKPGPGSISEALAMGLPVILKDDLATMVQERYNLEWVREQGVGTAIRRMRDLPRAIEESIRAMSDPAAIRRLQRLENRAVFEIPEILDQILAARQPNRVANRPVALRRR